MRKFIYLVIFITAAFCENSYSQTINAPSNLEAEPEDSLYIKVKWDDNSGNEGGFYIERSLDDTTNWENIGSVSQNFEIFLDYWVTRGRLYYYRVYAYNGALRSNYSNTASAVLLGNPNSIPQIPSNLHVTNVTSNSITINWKDNSNFEDGFIVAKKTQIDSFYQYIDTAAADILTFQEVGLTPDNVYNYKVCSYKNGIGISEYSNVVTARTEKGTIIINNHSFLPDKFYLGHNYPNPFNPATSIKFGIASNAHVKISVYNSQGKLLEHLISQNMPAGTYSIRWEASNYSSGIYFYKMEVQNSSAGNFSEMKKMILIK